VVAVQESLLLVGEVVGERAPGDPGLVGDGLDRDVVGAVLDSQAAVVLDEIRRTLASYAWEHITHGLPVTVSIGVAGLIDAEAPTQAGLLSTADRNLYIAKHDGRDRVVSGAQRDDRGRSYRDGTPAV
jgi:GGDEF domain-containing protein